MLIIHVLKLLFIAILFFYILLYLLQNTMIFPATKDPELKTPHWLTAVDFESLDKTALHGWLALQENSKEVPTLLYCHGNAGNILNREGIIYSLKKITNANIFIFDYRGYGRSAGSPNKNGVLQDAEAALKYLQAHSDIDPDKIVYLGVSLGGAVATELSVKYPPKALILKSTFARVKEMAPVPIFEFMLRSNFDSLKLIDKITCPKLFFHGTKDRIIPYHHGRRLFEKAVEPKEFHPLEGKDHNDLDEEFYYQTIKEFIEKVFSK